MGKGVGEHEEGRLCEIWLKSRRKVLGSQDVDAVSLLPPSLALSKKGR